MKTKRYQLSILILAGLALMACSGGEKKKFKLSQKDSEAQALKKCLGLSEKKRFEEASECLQIFKSNFPGSNYSQEAEIKIADNYYRKKDYLLAAESYKIFVQTNPHSEKSDFAYYRMGLSYEKEMPKKIDRDQSYLKEAKDAFAFVVANYPNSSYFAMAQAKYNQIRKRDALKHMYIGNFYFKSGEFRAAIPRYREVVVNYQDLSMAREALYKLALAYAKLGKKDIASQISREYVERYPHSDNAKKLSKKYLGV